MSKKAHHRRLGKAAARRQAERRRHKRQRTSAIAVGVVVALIGGGIVLFAFTRGGSSPSASASASPSATPTPSLAPVACGAQVPAAASIQKPQFKEMPAMTIDPSKTYTATMDTSCGQMTIKLLADQAPKTVNSFVFLARKKFFDGTKFHRIAPSIDIIQGGDPTGTGTGGPGYTIPDEYTGKEQYLPGVVAMANTGQKNSGGSQFFIVYGPAAKGLPPTYTIFGQVVKGLDVAQKIGALPLSGETPLQAVYLDKVSISESK